MALVNSKIDRSNPFETKINSDGEYSFMYHASASDGHVLEICYHGPNSNKNLANLETIYPLIF